MGCTASKPTTSRHISSIENHVNDLKVADAKSLDPQSITMLMWECRNQPQLVEILTQTLVDNSNRRRLFDGVEFYLPQLVHMIIHLETNWPKNTLQSFTLMVAQHSLHFALQLNWILSAAMEDYQPEDEFGHTNPSGDPLLFGRCAEMLHQLERAIAYGTTGEEEELEQKFRDGKITRDELNQHRIVLRHKLASEITETEESQDDTIVLSGRLLHKRWARKGNFSSKRWKDRDFRIQYKVLYCFRPRDGALKRVIPLHHVTVEAKEHHTHKYYFEVQEKKRKRVYKMVAPDEETRDKWIKAIRENSTSPPKYQSIHVNRAELSKAQQARYDLFSREREFVRDLTDICEDLRFVDVPERKSVLKSKLSNLTIPSNVYLPLCKSTDSWIGLVNVIPDKGHPFSTRERCPCLMTFEAKNAHIDVAHFMAESERLQTDKKQFISNEEAKETEKGVLLGDLEIATLWEKDDADEESKYEISSLNSMSKVPTPHVSAEDDEDTNVRVIAKSHDDLRQEVFIMQLMQFLNDTWSRENLDLYIIPYRILSTSRDTGLLQVVEDANSIDGWKKGYIESDGKPLTLMEHFKKVFPSPEDFKAAKSKFIRTLAGYSVATYVVGIKDRHNGNVMLDNSGQIIHIDFGFVLGMAPGKDKVPHTNFSMERAAFKLTPEMSEIMGGVGSKDWDHYVELCVEGLLSARTQSTTILTLVEIMAYKSNFPCFKQPGGGGARVLRELKQRLMLNITDDQVVRRSFKKMIHSAHNHRGTILYEKFQKSSNGIEPIF